MLIKSSTGCHWIINDNDSDCALVERLLKIRGIADNEHLDFLQPTLRHFLPDPDVLLDMQAGVGRVYSAIINKEDFLIIGDYDVDGVTSSALLTNYLHDIGVFHFKTYIPHRINDGYGINKAILDKFDENLIVTLDNGSTAYDTIEYAKDRDIVIIDHHSMDRIPNVSALINPHRPDQDNNELKVLCAAGVTFLFIVALNRKLRENNAFTQKIEPNLKQYLDLVALGTVCDAMPIVGINRALVTVGLREIKHTINVGLKALLQKLNIASINEETFSFFIGPMLNAPGRLSSAELSFKLLTCNRSDETEFIVNDIVEQNRRRQALESIILEQINCEDITHKFICAYNNNWPVGVIGIIAGKLKEAQNVPTFIISFNDDCIGHGSARSVPGIDISSLIRSAVERNILLKGGGHKMAAGFSIHKNNIQDFIKFLETEISDTKAVKEYICDGYTVIKSLTLDFIRELSKLAPFGVGNPVPKFILSNVMLKSISIIGKNKKHLSITFADEQGNTIRCVSFNNVDTALGRILLSNKAKQSLLDVLGSFFINDWNGKRTVNMNLIDVLIR